MENGSLNTFIGTVTEQIVMPLITLLAAIAFAVFVWGVVQMIIAAGDEEKRDTGKRHIVWGIIGLVILFGAGGIVRVLGSVVGSDAASRGSSARESDAASAPFVSIAPTQGSSAANEPQKSAPEPSFLSSIPFLNVFQPTSGGRTTGTNSSSYTAPVETPAPPPPEVPVKQVVLFAGQSNALGYGNNGAAPYTVSERVQIWTDTDGDGTGDEFQTMQPGTNTGTTANPRAWGPEVQFASDWVAGHAIGTLYIGKVVKGSTPLASAAGLDWSPQSPGELFDQARTTSAEMRTALAVPSLDAVFWMQGEQDATSDAWAGAYAANLTTFILRVRSEWMRSASGYIAAGQISNSESLMYRGTVQEAQSRVDETDSQFETFSTASFPMQADGLHYSAEGHIALGHAFYQAWK